MFTLYGSTGSGSAAVEAALLLCGAPFRIVRASSWEADSDQAALLKVNPLGQIPRAHLREHRPALYAVFERTEAHPVLADVLARHWPAGPAVVA